MKLEEITTIAKQALLPGNSTERALAQIELCKHYMVMADILVKLEEFECDDVFTEKVAERVGMGAIGWDQVTPREICQAVIDQLREDLEG